MERTFNIKDALLAEDNGAWVLLTGNLPESILVSRGREREDHHEACARHPVEKVERMLGLRGKAVFARWFEKYERNQKLSTCCRHPENHDIMAWYSSDADRDKGVPDIYIMICKENHCLRPRIVDPSGNELRAAEYGEAWHRTLCVGGSKDPVTGEQTRPRPYWEIR